MLGSKDLSEKRILKLFPSGGFFVRELLTHSLHGINGDSAANCHLMGDEKRRRNGYTARNCQLIDEESTGRMVISPGVTSSRIRNPLEEWASVRIY
jgi:hypothetical protein